MVLATNVGGRWSMEALVFLRLLAGAKATLRATTLRAPGLNRSAGLERIGLKWFRHRSNNLA